MKKLLLNPFEKISEAPLLALGLCLTIGGSLLGYLFSSRFDGVLDMHIVPGTTLKQPFIDNAINTLSLLLTLFMLGAIINRKTRFIDVLNTVLVARSPVFLLTLGNVSGFMAGIESKINPANPMDIHLSTTNIAVLVIFSIFSIGFLIWVVALLYNGFKTATNLKLTWHKIAFAAAILIAEILSKIVMNYTNY